MTHNGKRRMGRSGCTRLIWAKLLRELLRSEVKNLVDDGIDNGIETVSDVRYAAALRSVVEMTR